MAMFSGPAFGLSARERSKRFYLVLKPIKKILRSAGDVAILPQNVNVNEGGVCGRDRKPCS